MSLSALDVPDDFEDHFKAAYSHNSSFRAVLVGLQAHRESIKEQCLQPKLPDSLRYALIGRAELIQELLDLTNPPQ